VLGEESNEIWGRGAGRDPGVLKEPHRRIDRRDWEGHRAGGCRWKGSTAVCRGTSLREELGEGDVLTGGISGCRRECRHGDGDLWVALGSSVGKKTCRGCQSSLVLSLDNIVRGTNKMKRYLTWWWHLDVNCSCSAFLNPANLLKRCSTFCTQFWPTFADPASWS
jgi:hypothetical protein